MELKQAVYRRRAVRQYASDPVEKETLLRLIDAAIQAPSAVNEQPWHFTVVRDRALLARISREARAHLSRTSPAAWASPHSQDMLTDADFDIFYHAPALILISAKMDSPWAVADCALAAGNLMLSACAAELGTCWIGLAQEWLDTPEGKSMLGLPTKAVPLAPIIVGKPRGFLAPVQRKAPSIDWLD
jgi:nitroreductase